MLEQILNRQHPPLERFDILSRGAALTYETSLLRSAPANAVNPVPRRRNVPGSGITGWDEGEVKSAWNAASKPLAVLRPTESHVGYVEG